MEVALLPLLIITIVIICLQDKRFLPLSEIGDSHLEKRQALDGNQVPSSL